MTCHSLTDEISERRHYFLPCHVNKSDTGHTHLELQWRKENRNNFCQSTQICCREKEKVENNGSCKALCATRKRS